MEENNTEKYYYTIGEVAKMFGVNTSMIRYWENEFDVLRPRKNKKGNRMFTQRDVRYVHVIYHLTKVKGYTLAGAKQALKEKFSEYEERVMTFLNATWVMCLLCSSLYSQELPFSASKPHPHNSLQGPL